MPTIEQIRAARALLNWNQEDLANAAGLSQTGIARIENGSNNPTSTTLDKITAAFDGAGVEFIDGGVRTFKAQVHSYYGHDGFSFFLDDVFHTALKYGSTEKPTKIYLSNVVHENWVKWMGNEKWKNHTDRMTQHKNIMDVRIMVREGDINFPAKNYAQYKWFPKDNFRANSFYAYHDKLAFLNFDKDNVEILIMQEQSFARGYRDLFLIAWDNVAQQPKGQ